MISKSLLQAELRGDQLLVRCTTDRDTILVELIDQQTGETWGPTPAVVLEWLDRPCQRVEKLTQAKLTIEAANAQAIRIRIASEWHGLSAVVSLRIDGGELLASIEPADLTESKSQVFQLAGLHLLPGLMGVDPRHPGHLVLPLQTGAICHPDRHERLRDAFLIYGQQYRWEDLPLLPCCGVVRSQTASALLAIVQSGECDAECRVELDGHGAGVTGFALRYRYTRIDTVDPIRREMRIVPLRGQDAGYAGMGRRMHRFIAEHHGRRPLTQRCKDNPDLAYALTSYTVKAFLANKKIGSFDGSGEYQRWCTFEQLGRQLRTLRQAGLDRVWVQAVGWNPDGHDGMWPTRFPIDERVGGEAGWRDLVQLGRQLGYMIGVHDNYLDNYACSPDFVPDRCVGAIHGGPLGQGVWSGGMNHRGWGLAISEERLRGQMEQLRDLGVRGVHYIDAMGMPLELSYNPRHGEHRYRRACAAGIQHILDTASAVFSGSATEMGYLYAVLHCDCIAGEQSRWKSWMIGDVKELVDQPVPLWHMAVKGYIGYEAHQVHSSAIQCDPSDMTQRMLDMAELGIRPRLETSWVVPDWGAYPLEPCLPAIELEYDLMLRRLRGTMLEPMVDHEFLHGCWLTGDAVTRTCFGDGTVVLSDRKNRTLEIDGKAWPLPLDYPRPARLPVGSRPAEWDQIMAGAFAFSPSPSQGDAG
ncbi:MAG: hypothetical protein IT440_11290 [Phycisphaeraceae bacterium]|nr:hypothetical protein [Phycisphaeraceae bacterium]